LRVATLFKVCRAWCTSSTD